MRILCVFGRHNYGDPRRGEGYEYSNFIPALRALGHEVHLFDSWYRAGYENFAALNRALLEEVERLRPDVLVCVLQAYEIWLETLRILRDGGIPVLNWGTDDSWKYRQFSRYMAADVDLWATTSRGAEQTARRHGLGNFVLTQWGASSERMCEPLPAAQCRYDVTFVGSAYGNRFGWVERLRRHGFPVQCFGHGWENGAVPAERIPQIYRESRISLNFGDSGLQWRGLWPYRSRQIKARVFEVPAAGGCLVTQEADDLDAYYRSGVEIETFGGESDLVETLRTLLANPKKRDEIAWAGYTRTRSEHIYEDRFRPLLQILQARRREPKTLQSSRLDDAVAAHRDSPYLRRWRAMLVWPFALIWGAERGPRASRRALYELYWRVFGARTYSARGLPGRLFYRES